MIFKSLMPGSSIALVAPSSPFDPDLYEKGRRVLEDAGYTVVPGRSILHREGYLAGTDLDRVTDLTDALLDPATDAIVCIRGGYGSGRLLTRLLFSTLSRHPKIFLGHSDVTFLHMAMICKMGWTTFHGPNLTGIAESAERAENVLRFLSGKAEFSWEFESGQVLKEGRVEGPVLGGNLTCLSHMIGTPFMPDLAGALLLIEDCGEALYRLDRMLNHLKLAGILPRLGGILLGEFTNCAENGDIYRMVMDHVRYFDYPVVYGLPFGHGDRNDVIPLASPFLLDTHERVLKAIEAPVRA